jgi:hypothetical protein
MVMPERKERDNGLRSKIILLAGKTFQENTMAGLAIIALIIFFVNLIAPDAEYKILQIQTWIPLFIVVVCLEIFFIKENVVDIISKEQQSIAEISKSIKSNFDMKLFQSGTDFDDYLEKKLKHATHVRVTNISSLSCHNYEEQIGGRREGRNREDFHTMLV